MATHLWVDNQGNVWEVRQQSSRNLSIDGIYVHDRQGDLIAAWHINRTPRMKSESASGPRFFPASTNCLLKEKATLVEKADRIILSVPDKFDRTQIYKIRKGKDGRYEEDCFVFLKDGKPLKNPES